MIDIVQITFYLVMVSAFQVNINFQFWKPKSHREPEPLKLPKAKWSASISVNVVITRDIGKKPKNPK